MLHAVGFPDEEIPALLVHGWWNISGAKMSKSLGNSPDPLDLIEQYGADGVRLGMLLCSPAGNDILFDEKLCEQGRNFSNKLWNALRLVKGWGVYEGENKDNKVAIEWQQFRNVAPSFLGHRKLTDISLEVLAGYIDWTPFFQTWMLAGRFPDILKDSVVGTEATRLYEDAKVLLTEVVQNKLLQPRAVVGFYPAHAQEDDVVLTDPSGKYLTTFNFLRQQNKKAAQAPNFCLADYIHPEPGHDYIGMFAVTSGIGLEKLIEKYRAAKDDYNEIMIKALADRLAEALAEYMHAVVRKNLWGYVPDENLTNSELIDELYSGIRPAPGYPACPDHTEKTKIFDLLKAGEIGMELTESMAMWPASSVSGYYFSNPAARYFGLGKISRDQVQDYAKRRNMAIEDCEKWLAPVLGY
jgi:5-methyltetrahydrofolate--homocysteine methyltransferase